MNKLELLEKTIKNRRGYRYYSYYTEYDREKDILYLYHYNTLIVKALIREGKIDLTDTYGYSQSDVDTINILKYLLKREGLLSPKYYDVFVTRNPDIFLNEANPRRIRRRYNLYKIINRTYKILSKGEYLYLVRVISYLHPQYVKQLRFSIEDTTKLELPYYNPELYGIMHRRKESKERYPLEQRNIEETINTPVLYCNYCGKPLEFYLRQDYKDKPYSYCHNHIYLEFINILKGEDI